MRRTRAFAVAASAVLALSVALLPWYALDDYEPNGWDATWWARAAALAALATIVLLRLPGRDREATIAAALGLAFVALRVIDPPDFGFGFDGLKVPVERQAGCWVALASAALALAASLRLAWSPAPPPAAAPEQPGPAPGQPPEAPPPAASSAAAAP